MSHDLHYVFACARRPRKRTATKKCNSENISRGCAAYQCCLDCAAFPAKYTRVPRIAIADVKKTALRAVAKCRLSSSCWW